MKKWIIVPLIVLAVYLAAYCAWRWWCGSLQIMSLRNPDDHSMPFEEVEYVVNLYHEPLAQIQADSVTDERVTSWDALLFYPCLIGECWLRCPGLFLILERNPRWDATEKYDKIRRDRGEL